LYFKSCHVHTFTDQLIEQCYQIHKYTEVMPSVVSVCLSVCLSVLFILSHFALESFLPRLHSKYAHTCHLRANIAATSSQLWKRGPKQ